jgi:hypothetical protein
MGCQTCAKVRGALAATWRRVTRLEQRTCIVRGCMGSYPICRRHWLVMPLALRQRWRQETEYAGRPPSQSLIDDVNRRIAGKG